VLTRLCAYKQSAREVSRVCIVLGFSQECLTSVVPLWPLYTDEVQAPGRSSFINTIFVEAYGSTSPIPQPVTIWYQLVQVCKPCLHRPAQVRGRSQSPMTSPRSWIAWRSWHYYKKRFVVTADNRFLVPARASDTICMI
jgi:hypothetical protein